MRGVKFGIVQHRAIGGQGYPKPDPFEVLQRNTTCGDGGADEAVKIGVGRALPDRLYRFRVEALLHRMNPRAKLIRARFGDVPLSEVLNTGRFDFDQASTFEEWLSGKDVQIVTRENVEQDQLRLDTLLTIGDAMLQPVVEEIRDGELSLVFFRGDFSYTIRKMPGCGSIFVNSAYGGSRVAVDVPHQVVQTAQLILETAMRLTGSPPPLYARVDGVMVNGEFVLMELELIEPGLLMDIAPKHAARHFARVIAEAVGKDM